MFRDIPGQLALWSSLYGTWIYLILFLIIFAETGLVFAPLLPGDSLLFAVGALVALDGSGLSLPLMLTLLSLAAIIGDATNYWVGRKLGPKLFAKKDSKLLNPDHLMRTQKFFEKHGGKTVVLARFAPILRTYAPFVAGLGRMSFQRFFFFNVTGGILWIFLFTLLGYYFGNHPEVKSRFHLVILAIVVLSVLPVAIELFRARQARQQKVLS